jgi:hypothetical protein
VRIDYELTIDDFVAFNIFAQHGIPVIKRQRLGAHAVFVTIILLAIMELVFGTNPVVRVVASAIACGVSVIFIHALMFNTYAIKKLIRKKIAQGMYGTSLGRQSLEVTADFYIHTKQFQETRGSWQSIETIRTTTDYAYLSYDELHALIVPKRAFASELEWHSFLNDVNAWWGSRPILLRASANSL